MKASTLFRDEAYRPALCLPGTVLLRAATLAPRGEARFKPPVLRRDGAFATPLDGDLDGVRDEPLAFASRPRVDLRSAALARPLRPRPRVLLRPRDRTEGPSRTGSATNGSGLFSSVPAIKD